MRRVGGALVGKAVLLSAMLCVGLAWAPLSQTDRAEAQGGDAVVIDAPELLRANGAALRWSRYAGTAAFDRYEIHRSATAGFTPTSATLLTTIGDVDLTSYADTTAAPGAFSYKVLVAGTSSQEQRVALPAVGTAIKTLQPDPEDGKAAYLQSGAACTNTGTSTVLGLRGGATAERPLVQFDVHDIPSDAVVTEATLSLYRNTTVPTATTLDTHRVRSEWDEGTSATGCTGSGASWNETEGGAPWHATGGDIAGTATGSLTRAAGTGVGWDSFDVKSAVQQWVDGDAPNMGLLVKARNEASAPVLTYVADDAPTSDTLRPKLTVRFQDDAESEAPTVGITALADSSLLTGPAAELTADAGDDRRVEKVEFLVDTAVVGTDTAEPWAVNWDSRTVSTATHTLAVRATDDVGNVTSVSQDVEVANTAPPTTAVTSPSSRYVDLVKATGAYGHWRLGATSGTAVVDSSGRGNNGTASGTYLLGQTGLLTGDADKALKLRNATTDGRVTISTLNGQSSGALTVEAWISYSAAAAANVESEIASRGWGSAGGWRLSVFKNSSNQAHAKFAVNVAGTVRQITGAIVPGRSHIAGRFNGSNVGMHVNGAFVGGLATATQALNTTSSVILGGGLNEDVLLDEVALYPKSMFAAEAALRWDVGSGRTPTLTGNSGNTMVADATDDRAVSSVEFFVDGDYIGSDSAAPYDAPLHTQTAGDELWNGDHTLSTKAYDAEGQERASTTQAIKVDNSGGAAGYAAEYAEVSAAPPEVTYDPALPVQDDVGMEVDVTNRSAATWIASDVVVRPRWIAPDGTETAGTDVSLGTDLPAGQTRRVLVKMKPPALPDGQERVQYTLRVGAYDRSDTAHFDSRGCKPHDRPVIVKRAGAELGLEDWFQYDGEELGAGMQHLVNLGTGNSLVRLTPLSSTGRGLSTVLDLTYNSLEDRSESPLGDNWSLSISGLTRFGAPLDIHPNKADDHGGNAKRYIELTDGDGTVHRFTGRTATDGTVYWEEPAGVHLYLRQHSTTDPARKWAITRPDGVTFYYDVDGHPTSVEDHHGNRITYTLETIPSGEDHGWRKKRITAVTDAAGRAYTIGYHGKTTVHKSRIRGRVRSIRDHSGSEVTFGYYDDGSLRRISRVGGKRATGTALGSRHWYFNYTTSNGSGPAITSEAERGNPDPHTRNQSTRLFSVRDPRSRETKFSYVTSGAHKWKLASRTNRAAATTSFAYDAATRVTTLSAPLSRTWTYTFDAKSQPVRVLNPKNEATTLAWTADRHLERIVTPTSTGTATQRFAYNENGFLTDSWNEEDERTTLAYTDLQADAKDVAGKWRAGRTVPHLSRLREKTAPKATATTTVANDFRWLFEYDTPSSLGNLVRVTDPEGGVTNLVPNPDGTVAQSTDPNGNPTSFVYDPSGQPSRVTEQVSGTETRVTQLGYDLDGFLRWVQDPVHANDGGADLRSYRTYFDYDSWHRLGRQSTPKSTARDRGNLIWTGIVHDANDNVRTEYGAHYGRQWTIGGATTTLEYDLMDRTERVYGADKLVDPLGERWRFSYDAAGRLIQATDPRGMSDLTSDRDGATYFAYDELDRLIRESRDEVNGATVVRTLHSHYCYDKAGDMVASAPPAANTATVDCANPGAKASHFGYDLAHRPLRSQAPGKQPSTVAYDDNGNVEATTDEAGGTRRTSYDQRDLPIKLVEPIQGPASAPTRSATTRLQYDAGGRLIREASPRAVDVLGEQATYSQNDDYVTSYLYDGVDQLTRITLPKGPSVGAHYVHRRYDPNGNLRSVSQPVSDSAAAPEERRTDLRYFDPGSIQAADRPRRRLVHYDYTAEGWQASMTPQKPNGGGDNLDRQRVWSYYADGMLQEKRHGEGQSVDSYAYDANNNLTSVLDASGFANEIDQKPIKIAVAYDSLDRAVKVRQSDSEAGPSGNWTVTTYAYDLNSNVAERIDNRRETEAGAEVTPGRRHVFDYDDADWLTRQRDFASPTAPDPQRVIDTAYKATGWPAERKISRNGTARQLSSWDYTPNGSVASTTTKAGDGDPLTVKESHDLSYFEDGDTGPYLNGHRTRDVWRRDSSKTGVPCQSATCTTSYRYDGRDRLVREAQRRDGADRTTDFELTASGSVAWEHRVEDDVKWHSTYEGDQIRTRETYVKDGAGNFVKTQPETDDLRYFHDAVTGNLECVTTFSGSRPTCETASEPSVSDHLAADYSYTDDDKLRASRQWDRTSNLTPAPDDESQHDYDALDRPVEDRERHRLGGAGCPSEEVQLPRRLRPGVRGAAVPDRRPADAGRPRRTRPDEAVLL